MGHSRIFYTTLLIFSLYGATDKQVCATYK